MADIGSILGGLGVGGNIGKAIVQLELDSKKYVAELNAAEAQTAAGTKKIGGGFTAFGGLAKTALLGAGAAAVAFGAYSVKAAIESNDAQLKLANTFKNNKLLSDVTMKSFLDQADALRDLTGVDDEAITTGQALLGSFKLTGEQVQQLTPRVVDLAEKYDIDLQTAFKAVGKATAGSSGALARFGVVIDKNALSADAYSATLKGIGVAQGFAEASAKEEPWRVLGAQFEEVAEKVGFALLPALQDLASLGKTLIPVLAFMAKHIKGIALALAGFAALKYLPALLGSIAGGFKGLSAALVGVEVGGGIAATLGTVAAALPTIALSGPAAAGAIVELWDALNPPSNPADEIIAANEALSALPESAQNRLAFIAFHFEDAGRNAESFQGQVDAVNEALDKAGIKYTLTTGALERLVKGESLAGLGAGALADAQQVATDALDKAGNAAHRFGFKSKQAFQDFKSSVVESTRVTIGQFEKVGDAFTVTPQELRKQLDTAIKIAKRFGQDLQAILTDKSLTEKQRQALAALPPEYRRAFVAAGDEGKKELANQAVKLSNLNKRTWQDFGNKAKPDAKQGGGELGESFMTGAIAGIIRKEPALVAQIRESVRNAIEAGKREAGAESPSKVMAELGRDLMAGLANGIQDADQKVFDQLKSTMDKAVEAATKSLDKLKAKAKDFSSTISGAFSSFVDLASGFSESGMPIETFLQTQLAGAQQFSDILKFLKIQGASKGLIAQVAGAGPEGAAFGQALLQGGPQTIAAANDALQELQRIQKDTAAGLTKEFYGQKMDQLKDRVDRLGDKFERIVDKIEGHYHDIVVDGDKLAVAVSRHATTRGKRNGGNTGF